jgi:hypothetical protein
MRTKLAALLIAAASIAPIAAAAMPAQPASAAATCHTSSSWSRPPTRPTTYTAGSAGTVTITSIRGGLRVVSVHRNAGWLSFTDTAAGDSVDVYFRHLTHTVKFEAGIEDNGLMQRLITTC